MLLNFIISYFFPEFLPIKISSDNLNVKTLPFSQSTTGSHYEKRTECLKEFSKIIGFNPLKYIYKEGVQRVNLQMTPLTKFIIYLKYS